MYDVTNLKSNESYFYTSTKKIHEIKKILFLFLSRFYNNKILFYVNNFFAEIYIYVYSI